jgi:hypothetical protein
MIVPKPAVPLDLKVKRGLGTITSASSAPAMTWLDPPPESLAASLAADYKEQTVHAERPDAQGNSSDEANCAQSETQEVERGSGSSRRRARG